MLEIMAERRGIYGTEDFQGVTQLILTNSHPTDVEAMIGA